MRFRFLMLLALPLLVGCQDKKTAHRRRDRVGDDSTVHRGSASSGQRGVRLCGRTSHRPADDGAVAGLIKGKPFTPDEVTLEGTPSVVPKGQGLFPESRSEFDLPVKEGRSRRDGVDVRRDGKFEDPIVDRVATGKKDSEDRARLARRLHDDDQDHQADPKTVEGVIDLTGQQAGRTRTWPGPLRRR